MTDELEGQEPRKPARGQMEIDWVRGKRRTWIERVILPPFAREEADGSVRIVRTGRMKHLLRVLESFARDGGPCFLKEATLCRGMGSSERTVRRAIADCELRGLLIVDRSYYKGSASKYQIEWSAIAQAIVDHPDTTALIVPQAQAQVASQGSGIRGQESTPARSPSTPANSDFTPANLSVTPAMLSFTPANLSVTPAMLSELEGVHTTDRACAVLNHESNQCLKPMMKPSCTETVSKRSPGDRQDAHPTFAFRGFAGWPFAIEKKHLRHGETVQRLWEHALQREYVSPSDRLRFFMLSRYTAGMADRGEVRNAGAYFSSQVRAKNWLGSQTDEQAALKVILILDGGRQSPVVSDAVGSAQAKLSRWARDNGK